MNDTVRLILSEVAESEVNVDSIMNDLETSHIARATSKLVELNEKYRILASDLSFHMACQGS